MNEQIPEAEIENKKRWARRSIRVRTDDTLELSRRDINPEDDDVFRQIVAHKVDVNGKTLYDDALYLDMTQIDGPNSGERCRLVIWAERGRWPWSAPVQRVRVVYDY